jgi:hypothetical protein
MNELFRQSVIDNSEKIKSYICAGMEDEACLVNQGYDCETCITKALRILLEGESDE